MEFPSSKAMRPYQVFPGSGYGSTTRGSRIRERTPRGTPAAAPQQTVHALEPSHLRLTLTCTVISLFLPEGNLTKQAGETKECIVLSPQSACFIKICSINYLTDTEMPAGAGLEDLRGSHLHTQREHDGGIVTPPPQPPPWLQGLPGGGREHL